MSGITYRGKPLLCPFCSKKLVKGEDKKFKNKLDIILNQDDPDSPLRETYVCTCEESKDCFWDVFGDLYNNSDRKFDIPTEAINSFAHCYIIEKPERDRLMLLNSMIDPNDYYMRRMLLCIMNSKYGLLGSNEHKKLSRDGADEN